MKRPSDALTAKWEERLSSEGMPSEFPVSRRQSLADVRDRPDGSDDTGLSSSATFRHWTGLTHAVHALPNNYKGRAFLVLYVEYGYFERACRDAKISRRQGRNVLARFAETMKGQNGTN